MLDQPDPSVQEKLHLLLRFLGRLSDYSGQRRQFDFEYDYTVICARNKDEAEFLADTLDKQEFVVLDKGSISNRLDYVLAAKGWSELDRVAASGVESPNAFIAVWFHSSRSRFEQAINQGVTNAGYVPVRVDRLEHLNRIDDEIIAQIRQSRFLIADFTGQRNGVYFEAGFMLGLGRPVIWVCEKADLNQVHFDTRQYNIIDYSDSDDLRKRLENRIVANLGKGPRAPK